MRNTASVLAAIHLAVRKRLLAGFGPNNLVSFSSTYRVVSNNGNISLYSKKTKRISDPHTGAWR